MSSSSFFEIKRRKWAEVGVNRLCVRNTLYTPNWTKQLIAMKQLIFPGSCVAVFREWRLASCQLNVSPGGVLVELLAALSWVKWSLFTNGLFSVPKSPDKPYSFDELQIKTSYPSHGAVNQIVSLFKEKKKDLLHVWFIIPQGNCNWSMKSWYCAFIWAKAYLAILLVCHSSLCHGVGVEIRAWAFLLCTVCEPSLLLSRKKKFLSLAC